LAYRESAGPDDEIEDRWERVRRKWRAFWEYHDLLAMALPIMLVMGALVGIFTSILVYRDNHYRCVEEERTPRGTTCTRNTVTGEDHCHTSYNSWCSRWERKQ